jgi:DNA-binding beta-propeller fold protein YncE
MLSKIMMATGGISSVAYVITQVSADIISVSVANPNNVAVLDSLALGTSNLNGIAVDSENKVAYVVNISRSLFSVDISDPENMSILQTLDLGSSNYTPHAIALDVDRGYAYIAGEGYILSVDISDPENMTVSHAYTNAVFPSRFWSIALDLTNEIAILAGVDELHTVDISTPSSMVIIDDVSSLSMYSPLGVVFDPGGYIYASSGTDNSVLSFSIDSSGNIAYLNTLSNANLTGSRGLALDTENDVLYVAAKSAEKLVSIDVSTPSSMSELDNFASTNWEATADPVGVQIYPSRDIAIVAAEQHLTMVDISNPSSLSELADLDSTDLTDSWTLALST